MAGIRTLRCSAGEKDGSDFSTIGDRNGGQALR